LHFELTGAVRAERFWPDGADGGACDVDDLRPTQGNARDASAARGGERPHGPDGDARRLRARSGSWLLKRFWRRIEQPRATTAEQTVQCAGLGTGDSVADFRRPGVAAYQTTDGADDRVHLVRVDGCDDHAIASELSGRTAHPDFSSDGRHLVIDELASEADVDQIYIGDGNGDHFRLMARCAPPACLDHWEAAWSPDGQRLVMSTAGGRLTEQGPTRFGLAVVATQSVHTVLDHPSRDGQDHFARWSPDGQSLIFWRERGASEGSPQSAIFRIDADGARLHRLTAWSLAAGDPDWSPDGSSIVFSTHPLLIFEGGAESELYAMKPDGTGLRQLTHDGDGGPRATQPRWTRDGTAIVYVETGSGGFPRHISAIRPDGTDDASVLAERDLYTHPTLQPPV
jgi:Tol biopolymer transport system component